MEKEQIVGEEIYQLETLADGIRNTGYKSIYNALAELVDNSLEEDAKAKNVLIIGTEDLFLNQQRITKYAVLDDGVGMADDVLAKCLKIGFSTRRQRKGMGRFGVGLPQASFYASTKVEVYSWTKGIENAKCVYIDLDLVSSGEQTRIIGPIQKNIPSEYEKFINLRTEIKNYDYSIHGTLVVWPKCDKPDPKRWNTCRRNLAEDLGRKYRWMLNDESTEIATVKSDDLGTFEIIRPNDPLFLMEKSQCCLKNFVTDSDARCGNFDEVSGLVEPMFEPFTDEDNSIGIVNKEVYYFDKNGNRKTSIVKITFSIVKEKYYSSKIIRRNPGDLPYGKAAKKNMGISIVRQGREIDFGKFGYFDDINKPHHRWWGCEISFGSELDEAFGISNNKQQVDLRPIDNELIPDYEGNEPIWLQLKSVVAGTITKMYSENQERRSGSRSRTGEENASTATSEAVKRAEENNPEISVPNVTTPTEVTPEVKEEAKKELESEGFEDPTEEQIIQYLDSNTRIKYVNRGVRSAFLDYEESIGVLKIYVNIDHRFYQDFVCPSYMSGEEMKTTFELFLTSLVKSMHKLEGESYKTAMDKLIDNINTLLKTYLRD